MSSIAHFPRASLSKLFRSTEKFESSEKISRLKEAFVVEKCFFTTETFLSCFPYLYILIF